ncbi:DinB family protein [Planctomicrobium sp. SH661]|uniref:DinB family protein n=1 Tax=Planctomicrobium sp. SH661 TaxID=3448124 RepID=UPI003F5C80E8
MQFESQIREYLAGADQLEAAVAGMTDEQLAATPVPGTWSTQQVICHIADFEPVYADRMKRVIAEEDPLLLAGDPDQFAARLSYNLRNVREELELVRLVRKQMATILLAQPDAVFARTGRHSEVGPISLEDLLKRITGHITHHLKFIEQKRIALGLN